MGYGLTLTGPTTEYTYGSASYASSPSARPYTPPSNGSIFPGALAANMSDAESNQSERTSPKSSSSHPSPPPRSAHRFDPMVSTSRPTVRRRKTKSSDDFSDDDDDYAPVAPQTGVNV